MRTPAAEGARPRPAPRALPGADGLQGGFFGPEFAEEEIAAVLEAHGVPYRRLAPEE